ncbi:type VII secretion protein EccE [Mycobacterium sp. DSM 3803]|nr:type VII secretion protein EccE [Mycobacterium sp. DSM 3803]
MKPMAALGVQASSLRLSATFVVAVAAVAVITATVAGPPAIVLAVVAVLLVAALGVLTWRREHILALGIHRFRRSPKDLLTLVPAVDHTAQWPESTAAVRGSGDTTLAVVAVDGPSHTPSTLDHQRVVSPAGLPIAVVADALRQFDVQLEGIDVLSSGRRRAPNGHHHYAATYSRRVGDHAAMGTRRTLCVLRMNSQANAAAVLSRDGVAATVTACAQRLATELTARHCPSRVVDAGELAAIDEELRLGVAEPASQLWGGLRHGGGMVTSYWVSPDDITTATLDRVWVPDCDHTATTLQLRPGPDGTTRVGLLVRYATGGPLQDPPVLGLNPLSGRHDRGFRAGLADAATPPLLAPHRLLAPGEDLLAPIGANGVIIGSTMNGHPLLLNLAGAAPGATSTVTVAGELALLIQLAMCHAAIGYHVIVRSTRPQAWRPAAGAGLHIVPGLPPTLPDNGEGAMVIYDDPRASAPVSAARAAAGPKATITLRLVPARAASVADVHMEQDSPNTCGIRTAAFSYRERIDLSAERDLLRTQPRDRVA